MDHLAVGLADGTVLLYRNFGQVVRSGSGGSGIGGGSSSGIVGGGSGLPKPKVIHESPTEPITGLGFRESSVGEDGEEERVVTATTTGAGVGASSSAGADPNLMRTRESHLFIVTTNRVLFYHVDGRGSGTGSAPIVIDEVGCGLGCVCMERRGKNIIVAREEAIYLCGIEGRGSCYAYEGEFSEFGHLAKVSSWLPSWNLPFLYLMLLL